MNIRNLVGVAATGLALILSHAQTALANEAFEKSESINPEILFKGIVREDDVSLLFQHLRESLAAAARGEEPRENEALNQRAEQIQREVAARGSVLLDGFLSAIESAAKRMVRERLNEFRSSIPRNTPYPSYSAPD